MDSKRSIRFWLVMKVLFAAAFVLAGYSRAGGQSKYIDRAGTASFFSSAPIEDIAANSTQAVSILDVATGDVVASVRMRSFDFKKSLMEEHFNENYVESHKYPQATFKGRVRNIEALNVSREGRYVLDIAGEITLHGVTRSITTKTEAVVTNGTIAATAVFPLRVADFKIDVPRLVIHNIAEVVEVTVSFRYAPM